MSASIPRAVRLDSLLLVLHRDALRRLARACGVRPGRHTKRELAGKIRATRLPLSEVLQRLRSADLRRLAAAHDVAPGGARRQLILRLLLALAPGLGHAEGILSCVRSFSELQQALARTDSQLKGETWERFCQLYLQLAPPYAHQLEEVWLLDETPQAVLDTLNLPDEDIGVDLIAKARDGGYWLVQAKYRSDTERAISFQELATFAALASGRSAYALVLTTTDGITRHLRHLDDLGVLDLSTWLDLGPELFRRMAAKVHRRPSPLRRARPRPHQARALEQILEHLRAHERGKGILPCGAGKTLLGFWTALGREARTIVVAVPSLALVRQALTDWSREILAAGAEERVATICVCSDRHAGRPELDALTARVAELAVPCCTDPARLATWLEEHRQQARIVFTTYHSSGALAEAARRSGTRFDLAIFDEAHRTTGRRDGAFSHLLFDRNVEIERRMFLTATERSYRGDSEQVVSMDDESIYGATCAELSFSEAIQAEPEPILSDCRVLVVTVTRPEVEELIERRAFVELSRELGRQPDAHALAGVIALRKATARYRIRHAVSFHSSIRRASDYQAYHDAYGELDPEAAPLETFHVSSRQRPSRRARNLRGFRQAPRALITNARCLNEGVDVPGIDCVVFADPRKSTVDIVQAVGRALRRAPHKRLGYVLLPLLVEPGADVGAAAETSSFQAVVRVLRAMASVDARIVEYFRAVAGGQRPRGGVIRFELPQLLEQVDVEDLVRALELRCWGRLARLAWRPFEEAWAWARELGLANVAEWEAFCHGELPGKGQRPPDVPIAPHWAYREQGWAGYGDFLGTGNVRFQAGDFRPFPEARAFVHTLELANMREWHAYCRGDLEETRGLRPADVPTNPGRVYADQGWRGLGDWLGTGAVASRQRRFRSFARARAWARTLGLKSAAEWRAFCRGERPDLGTRPDDVPAGPEHVYADQGWQSYGDFLGTGQRATRGRRKVPFAEARAYAQGLGLQGKQGWFDHSRRAREEGSWPEHMPVNPSSAYRDAGWQGWGDFLGTGTVAPFRRRYRAFPRARAFARSLGLRTSAEWSAYCRGGRPDLPPKPADVPAAPQIVYREQGWAGMREWLGTNRRGR